MRCASSGKDWDHGNILLHLSLGQRSDTRPLLGGWWHTGRFAHFSQLRATAGLEPCYRDCLDRLVKRLRSHLTIANVKQVEVIARPRACQHDRAGIDAVAGTTCLACWSCSADVKHMCLSMAPARCSSKGAIRDELAGPARSYIGWWYTGGQSIGARWTECGCTEQEAMLVRRRYPDPKTRAISQISLCSVSGREPSRGRGSRIRARLVDNVVIRAGND